MKMASDYSDLFAAAMPCASNAGSSDPDHLANVPLCVVAGDKDEIGTVETIQSTVAQIQEMGGEVLFTVLPDSTHSETCQNAFSEDRLEWVFGHVQDAPQQPLPAL